MIAVRKAGERGYFDHGWLKTYHTFSFSDYHDPAHMGFRSLRVINEDWVESGKGFGTHSHRDMEIITYILAGALEHKDSMGNTSVIKPGEVQRMTAGTGVTHSEFNHGKDEPVHLLQIWILPRQKGLTPGYEQKFFGPVSANQLRLIASSEGRQGSVTVNQDILLYDARIGANGKLDYKIMSGRGVWVQVIRGEIGINGQPLKSSDGAAIQSEEKLGITSRLGAEILLFDLA